MVRIPYRGPDTTHKVNQFFGGELEIEPTSDVSWRKSSEIAQTGRERTVQLPDFTWSVLKLGAAGSGGDKIIHRTTRAFATVRHSLELSTPSMSSEVRRSGELTVTLVAGYSPNADDVNTIEITRDHRDSANRDNEVAVMLFGDDIPAHIGAITLSNGAIGRPERLMPRVFSLDGDGHITNGPMNYPQIFHELFDDHLLPAAARAETIDVATPTVNA